MEKHTQLEIKESFEVLEHGHAYTVPMYIVVDRQGLVPANWNSTPIQFVRGSKDPEDADQRKPGTLHEHLMAMMIYDLQLKQQEVPSRETALAITNLQQALFWLRQRQLDRQLRQVLGTKNS